MIVTEIEYFQHDDGIDPCMTVRLAYGPVLANNKKYVIPQNVAWIFNEDHLLADRVVKIAKHIGADPLSSSDCHRIYKAINDKLDDLVQAKPYSMLNVQPLPIGEAKVTLNGKTSYYEI